MGVPSVGEVTTGELLLGPNAVREALRAGRRKVRRIFLARDVRDTRLGEIVVQAGRQGIPVRQVTRDRLASLAGTEQHQGIVALADPFAYADPEEVAARTATRSPLPIILALDGIEDPQNLGGILRTAEVFGVDAIIIPKHRAAGVTASVLRASSGAAEHVPVARTTSMAACLERLKALGYWVCGAAVEGGTPVHQADLIRPLALIVGGEHRGLRPGVRDRCDMLVTIPMKGRLESLNAGVATAIILYEALRQRLAGTGAKKMK